MARIWLYYSLPNSTIEAADDDHHSDGGWGADDEDDEGEHDEAEHDEDEEEHIPGLGNPIQILPQVGEGAQASSANIDQQAQEPLLDRSVLLLPLSTINLLDFDQVHTFMGQVRQDAAKRNSKPFHDIVGMSINTISRIRLTWFTC